MREIKFRAWDKRENRWWDRSAIYLTQLDGSLFWYDDKNEARVELSQFTGLRDKNGKEIYEGDIVFVPYERVFHKNKKVKWNEDGKWNLFGMDIKRLEVVGNIYENADLLK